MTETQLNKILKEHERFLLLGKGGKRANLQYANLIGANLQDANLIGANLKGANLKGANLRGANLIGANLQDANLRGTNFRGANLRGTNFRGADLGHYSIVPDKGQFTVFKKLSGGAIAELLVPENAERVGGLTSRKCRVEFAKVVSIVRNGKKIKSAPSLYYDDFRYVVGKIVRPNAWDADIRVECTHGIHCFITKKEAEDC